MSSSPRGYRSPSACLKSSTVSTSVWFLWDWVITVDSEVRGTFLSSPLTAEPDHSDVDRTFLGQTISEAFTTTFFRPPRSSLFTLDYWVHVVFRQSNPWCHWNNVRALAAPRTSSANTTTIQTACMQYVAWLAPIGVTGEACKPVIFSYIVISDLSATIFQTVLVLRTYALWDCNRRIYLILMGLNIAASLVLQSFVIRELLPGMVTMVPNPLPAPYNGCMPVFHTGTWNRSATIVIFESIMAVFLIVKFVENIQQGKTSRVLYILFRDGFIEFIVGSILCLLTGSTPWGSKYGVSTIFLNVTTSVSSICCARLLLNIKDVMKLSDPSDPLEWQPRWTLMNVGSLPSSEQQDNRVYEPPGVYEVESPAVLEMSQIEMFDDFAED
ncbi:hypothetical protein DL93DRAFT_2099516 [Clavulina sp. PMI_390]|nr:hypothetical protein DL93DRAFT_2099516 [Clavulina sp. PMI_390]